MTAATIKHRKTATLADQPGVEVNKAEWNDTHAITGLTDGQLIVGATAGEATIQTVSGDAILSATGVLTVTKTNGSSFATIATSGAITDATGTLLVPNGGTGLASGTSGGVPYFNATNTMASSGLLDQYQVIIGGGAGNAPSSSSALTFGGAAAGTGLTVSAGTATTNVNALSITQTWNNAGVTFTGIFANFSNTNSGASSLLMDLQFGSASQLNVKKDGTITLKGSGHFDIFGATGGSGVRFGDGAGNYAYMQMLADGDWRFSNLAVSSFIHLVIDANNVAAFKNGTTAQTLRVYGNATGSKYAQLTHDGTNAAISSSSGGVHYSNQNLMISATAPTVTSGFGTSPSIASNGTGTFRVTVGTGGTDSAGVLAMPAAATGWNAVIEVFNPSGTNLLQETAVTASGTTSLTLTNYTISTGIATAWPAGTVLIVHAMAY